MKYLMCNLKSNKSLKEILEYKNKLNNLSQEKIKFILFPPNLYISFFYNTNYLIGCQDLSIYNEGSHTGEVLAKQLASLKVKYCLLNHFEQELSINDLIPKIKNANMAKIKVVLFIGEREPNTRENTKIFLLDQLSSIINKLNREEQENLIIAYEPIWAINQEEIKGAEEIAYIINELKEYLKTFYNLNIPIIYGGGVNINNIENLLKYDIIDGYILGSCSLNPENILNIINKI